MNNGMEHELTGFGLFKPTLNVYDGSSMYSNVMFMG